MERKKYERLHREYRQLERAFNRLCTTTNRFGMNTYRPARVLIVEMQADLMREIGNVEPAYDHLSEPHTEALVMGSRNRMANHPTPKLEGI